MILYGRVALISVTIMCSVVTSTPDAIRFTLLPIFANEGKALELFAMANDPDFVTFIIDQIDDSCEITYRNMFGGGALYSKAKVVALICDDQLFVKPTEAGRSFIGDVVEAPPYPGAKLSFLIQDEIDDGEWLTQLISVTEAELPKPRPKKKKKRKTN